MTHRMGHRDLCPKRKICNKPFAGGENPVPQLAGSRTPAGFVQTHCVPCGTHVLDGLTPEAPNGVDLAVSVDGRVTALGGISSG